MILQVTVACGRKQRDLRVPLYTRSSLALEAFGECSGHVELYELEDIG